MSLLVVLRPTIVRSDVQPMWGDRGEMYCKRSFHVDLTSTSPHVQGESKNSISKNSVHFFFCFLPPSLVLTIVASLEYVPFPELVATAIIFTW